MSECSSGPGAGVTPAETPETPEITELLGVWKGGGDRALERLIPAVYLELRRLALRHLEGERAGHTLQPTALVHEAFLKLRGLRDIQWQDRTHFFAFSSRLMRRILVDHARGRMAAKRGADSPHVSLLDAESGGVESTLSAAEMIDLDRALDRLAAEEPRLARLVEVRFFGGLNVEEAAAVLDCSPRTVKRDWAFARAWLLQELGGTASGTASP
ncbi:MAG TPA: sigma-70 family RNA polymerase sigma factor [Thermoanaerobaculia bacterium]|nr:sigma-70 family RNA polymerase sigma factor [Thermoanaerobaculia bacterium]